MILEFKSIVEGIFILYENPVGTFIKNYQKLGFMDHVVFCSDLPEDLKNTLVAVIN